MTDFKPLYPKKGHFYADPFIFKKHDKTYVFYEDYIFYKSKGVIAVREVYREGNFSNQKVVLERDYHLSYPFLFEWSGNIYMIPETSQNLTIEVYQATDFPERWELYKVLINNINASDTTLYQYAGKYWMFTHILNPNRMPNVDLHLFYADSPFGEWKSHPQNPVISDIRTARPGGNIFMINNNIIRPGQNCSICYGGSISLNNIEVISDNEYKEVIWEQIYPYGIPDNQCIHTFNFNEDYTVIDGKVIITDFHKIGRKFASFFYKLFRLFKRFNIISIFR